MKHNLGQVQLRVRSMGKDFAVLAVFDDDAGANAYMEAHPNAAVMAVTPGGLIILCDKYEAREVKP